MRTFWRQTAILVAFAGLASTGLAETFGVYRVVGVERNDVLNVRGFVAEAASVADAPIIGHIQSSASDVFATGRTTQLNGQLWREIDHEGVQGWVNDRFLSLVGEPRPGKLPSQLFCEGAEPFWSIRLDGNRATFNSPDAQRSFTVVSSDRAANRITRWAIRLRQERSQATSIAVILTDQACADGMSDVDYPMEIVWAERNGPPLQGCCSGRR